MAAAYAVVFFFVLVYVAIIAAKLARLQRETSELVELARRKSGGSREPPDRRICSDRDDEATASPGPDGIRQDQASRPATVWRAATGHQTPLPRTPCSPALARF